MFGHPAREPGRCQSRVKAAEAGLPADTGKCRHAYASGNGILTPVKIDPEEQPLPSVFVLGIPIRISTAGKHKDAGKETERLPGSEQAHMDGNQLHMVSAGGPRLWPPRSFWKHPGDRQTQVRTLGGPGDVWVGKSMIPQTLGPGETLQPASLLSVPGPPRATHTSMSVYRAVRMCKLFVGETAARCQSTTQKQAATMDLCGFFPG